MWLMTIMAPSPQILLSFREHAGAITRVYKEKSQRIMDALKKRSLRLSSLVSVEGNVSEAGGKKCGNLTLITKSMENTERLVELS